MKNPWPALFCGFLFFLMFFGCAAQEAPREQLPELKNSTELLNGMVNCTPALYYKERDAYNIRIELLGMDNSSNCFFSYEYTPTASHSAIGLMPSNRTLAGTCTLTSHQEQYIDCSLEMGSIMVVEMLWEKNESGITH